jgi:hypothetical protein
MEFPLKSCTKYADYLVREGFTGKVLECCIGDSDMKDNMGMLMGDYKMLKFYITTHSTVADTTQQHSSSTSSGTISKIPRPEIKMDSSQLEFDQFAFEWKKYKAHYRIQGDQISTNLFFCCSNDLRQHIRTKQNRLGLDNWKEEELLNVIKDLTTSKISPIVHIQEFMQMKQNVSEKCQDYFRRLQFKASCCDFTCSSCNENDRRVKEKFILGLKDKIIQRHVLKTESIQPGTALEKILTEAITLEQSMSDQSAINGDTTLTAFMAEGLGSESSSDHDQVQLLNRNYKSSNKYQNNSFTCNGCGSKDHQNHERSQKCRAWRMKCNFCAGMGHIEKVCFKAKGQKRNSPARPAVKSMQMSCMFVGEISSLDLNISVLPSVAGHVKYLQINVFPDTGANVCLVGPRQLQQLKLKAVQLNNCHNNIAVAGGSSIVATKWFSAKFKLNSVSSEQIVYYAEKAKRFFLSRQVCIDLQIVPETFPYPPSNPSVNSVDAIIRNRSPPKRPTTIPFHPCHENIPKLKQYIIDSFADSVFNKNPPFPKLSTPPAHIHLKHDFVTPKPAYWPAVVAEHWKEAVKKSIDRDVEAGILVKVPFNEPTTWCARMVVVPKRDGRPRRTVDYQRLNTQCIREPNHGESPFHTARRIPPQTYKSVFDAVDGYHSVELDHDSSLLTTFITPWGRYRYLRFPQGHVSAGDAFNGRVQEILSDIPRLVRVVDDMCIFDDTIEGAFWHAWNLLETCARNGVVLNESKIQFCSKTINFAGLMVTANGVQPSAKMMSAIRDFPPPTDITKARAFFGLVNQVQWAYANGAEMAPFRDLVKPNAQFAWTDELKLLFEKSKLKILQQVKDGIQKYETTRLTCLQTDFSKSGLGYLLLQKYCSCSLEKAPICCSSGWKLVFAGSRFTKGAEERYAPTEGELLAVAWALNHAHVFTKGCPRLLISTDHKPLLGILNDKPFESISNPRILRLKEQTIPYDFIIKYNEGKWNRGPDALSRSPQNRVAMLEVFLCSDCESQITSDMETDSILAVSNLDENGSISLVDVKNAAINDPVMEKLITTIENGFPCTQHLTDPLIRSFFNVRENLWIQNEIVMFKGRIVIPTLLRERCLQMLHIAHQGVEGMKSRANECIYWPGLNADIQRKRNGCITCNRIAPSQAREPLNLLPFPDYPFQHICMDAFQLGKYHYVAVVDKFSGWLIVFDFKHDPKSKNIVDCLRSVFKAFGTPEKLFTDGGTPFQAGEMKTFLSNWKVDQITSSASYPQGNGRAELAVKSAKRILRDNLAPNGSLNTDAAARALLQYRNTPLQYIGLSPSQLLFHRKLRDGLPTNPMMLKPNKLWIIAAKEREAAYAKRNEKLFQTYNHRVRELPVLNIGTEVLIQDVDHNKRWSRYGTIMQRSGRKYTIRVQGSGRVITRNRIHLKMATLTIPPDTDTITYPTSLDQEAHSTSGTTQEPQKDPDPGNPVHDPVESEEPPTDPPQNQSGELQTDPPNQREEQAGAKLPLMLRRLLPHNSRGMNE